MTQQTIVAYFDSWSDADAAKTALRGEGLGAALIPEEESTYAPSGSQTSYDHRKDEGGFWGALSNLFLPHEDRYAYAEGLSRGGVALSVTVDEAQHDRVIEMLERLGAVDLDERETEWREAGWPGYAHDEDLDGPVAAGATRMAAASAPGTAEGDEAVIPVVEERLRVGKRVVTRNGMRIRVYVVETPVEERVMLREEHVRVERRPLDHPTAADASIFQERTIDVEEHDEEAVVSKEVVVTEELHVRKSAEEHEQTIRDTVRRTEVEVDDEGAVANEPSRR